MYGVMEAMQKHYVHTEYVRAAPRTRMSPLLYAMERLEQIEPEALHGARRTMQDYALAYVEYYKGDVPNLEREREFLVAALAQAWQREEYAPVVRLVDALACLASRLGNADLGQQLLLWGLEAARQLRDQRALARFLSRYASLLWSRGRYGQGQQAWIESQEVAHAPGRPACLWEPLGNMVYIADILGSLGAYAEVQRFSALLLDSEICDPASRAAILFIRAFYARFAFELDKASDDLNACATALATQKSCTPQPSSSFRHYVEAAVQTEFARLRGDDIGSHVQAMKTVSLARAVCDPYATAELLVDQAMYAYYRGTLHDEIPLLVQLNTLSRFIEAPHIRGCYVYFQQKLPASAQTQLATLLNASPTLEDGPCLLSLPAQKALPLYCEPLSQRELEVVRLAACGYSNHEIAEALIIALQTVKKHLEHIYNKLDVHNRTQMVAVARAMHLLQ
jgi:ATP/maltotriose-dependent transcriptional regulator MalT